MPTKNRILDIAVKAFNQKGYHAYTLADLALLCKMSRGNLAYHYKFKEDILNDVVKRMQEDIENIQKDRKDFPAFSNLSLDVRTFGLLQKNYTFVFRDMSILEHHSVHTLMNSWSENAIKRNLASFAFAIEVGNMKDESYDGLYYQLAVNAWLISYYWVAQKSVRTIGKKEVAEKMVWNTILPHFTDKGLTAFKQFYGSNYLKQMGAPISKYIKQEQIF